MRKLKVLLVAMITVLGLFGCDNNKGPFVTRMENGIEVLYSGEKLATGSVAQTVRDDKEREITVSEIYYDKGVPAGNFNLYNLEGVLVVEGEGVWEGDLFTGTIKQHYNEKFAETFDGTVDLRRSLLDFEQVENQWKTLVTNKNIISGFAKQFLIETPDGIFYMVSKEDSEIPEYFYENGNIFMRGGFNEETGTITIYTYYSNGNLKQITEAIDEKNYYQEEYYQNGKLKFQGAYEEGILNGEVKLFHENGNLRFEGVMVNGSPDGVVTGYHENGNIQTKETWKNGKLNGKKSVYDEGGNLLGSAFYRDNEFKYVY